MMKKFLATLLMLLISGSAIHAYTFSYKNATSKPIYFEPYAWGTEGQFKFFKGEAGRTDGWGVKGPQRLAPGEQKTFDFLGVWCHGKIMVGYSPNRLTEIPELMKTDQEQYNKIISSLTKVAIGSAVATAGASGAIIFAGIQLARLFEKALCQNYHFIIGETAERNAHEKQERLRAQKEAEELAELKRQQEAARRARNDQGNNVFFATATPW